MINIQINNSQTKINISKNNSKNIIKSQLNKNKGHLPVQVHLLPLNTLVIHQVGNHKLHFDKNNEENIY